MATASLVQTDSKLFASGLHTSGDLQRLGPEWKELFRRIRCDSVFLSFEWMSEWWRHFGRDNKLFVVVVRDKGGSLAGLAPLYISSEAGPLRIRRLGFLGDKAVASEYLDFLLADTNASATLDNICQFLLNHRSDWDYVELSDSRADSIATTSFRKYMEDQGMTVTLTLSSTCPYVTLPDSPDAYFSSLGSRLQHNLKYYKRALLREGSVEFVTVQDAQEIDHAFDDLLRLHRVRSDVRGGSSAFLDPRVTGFHRAALKTLSSAGWAQVYLLKLRGQSIAALYAFSTGTRMSFYQSGMDPRYSRFSVGVLLIASVIETAIRSRHAEFDFLRGNEPYKSRWANSIRQQQVIRFFDRRATSRIAQTIQLLSTALRHCKVSLRSAAAKVTSLG